VLKVMPDFDRMINSANAVPKAKVICGRATQRLCERSLPFLALEQRVIGTVIVRQNLVDPHPTLLEHRARDHNHRVEIFASLLGHDVGQHRVLAEKDREVLPTVTSLGSEKIIIDQAFPGIEALQRIFHQKLHLLVGSAPSSPNSWFPRYFFDNLVKLGQSIYLL
jgi:hypothetical protein